MYRVALCDGEQEWLSANQALVEQVLNEMGVSWSMEGYSAPEALLRAVATGEREFHLLILGINFQGGDGIMLAEQLRAMGCKGSVLFITSNTGDVFRGYKVQALRYLLKPAQPEALREAIEYDLENNFYHAELFFSQNRELHTLWRSELVYAESCGHYLELHRAWGGTLRFIGSLQEFRHQLPPWQFAQCHKSFCVGLSWVQRVGHSSIWLRTGESVPVSRGYSAQFRAALLAR